MNTPGQRLRWYIKEVLHATQADISEATGRSQGAVSNYINDSREMDLEFLSKLRHKFQLNPTWIITGDGIPRLPEPKEIQNSIQTLEQLRLQHFQTEADPALKEVIEGALELAKSDRTSLEIVRNLVKKFLERK